MLSVQSILSCMLIFLILLWIIISASQFVLLCAWFLFILFKLPNLNWWNMKTSWWKAQAECQYYQDSSLEGHRATLESRDLEQSICLSAALLLINKIKPLMGRSLRPFQCILYLSLIKQEIILELTENLGQLYVLRTWKTFGTLSCKIECEISSFSPNRIWIKDLCETDLFKNTAYKWGSEKWKE